jgi:gamma-glutamylaminecyclotransferase
MYLLFVYGSLKQGYPNAHINQGERIPGVFRTALPHRFYLAKGTLPCLLPANGEGFQVRGELYRVDDSALARMDVLEEIGQPGGYERVVIDVERCDAGTETDRSPLQRERAFVYLQSPDRLAGPGPHVGPLDFYTLEHALWLDWEPSQPLPGQPV